MNVSWKCANFLHSYDTKKNTNKLNFYNMNYKVNVLWMVSDPFFVDRFIWVSYFVRISNFLCQAMLKKRPDGMCRKASFEKIFGLIGLDWTCFGLVPRLKSLSLSYDIDKEWTLFQCLTILHQDDAYKSVWLLFKKAHLNFTNGYWGSLFHP